MTQHRLVGLETDNLLGFLALLGLLRSLERSRPAWNPRAYFGGTPLNAWLELTVDVTEGEIALAASEGCSAYAAAYSFGSFADLTFDGDQARVLLNASRDDADRATLLSALCSDAALKPKQPRIDATPLCAIFGQGHQHFLSRLTTVANGFRGKDVRKDDADPNDPALIAASLFRPWERNDRTDSFRWDHAEDRSYALRFTDPSRDAPKTQHGATRLAILGLMSFQSAPQIHGQHVALATRGVSRGRRDRRVRITWPIWSQAASLETIHAMLDDPELSAETPSRAVLARRAVDQLRRVYRFSKGKFLSFSRAEVPELRETRGG